MLDDQLIILKDYAKHVDIDAKILEMIETTLLVDVLDFDVTFTEEEYYNEIDSMANMTCKLRN